MVLHVPTPECMAVDGYSRDTVDWSDLPNLDPPTPKSETATKRKPKRQPVKVVQPTSAPTPTPLTGGVELF